MIFDLNFLQKYGMKNGCTTEFFPMRVSEIFPMATKTYVTTRLKTLIFIY